jgi:glycosyltransferase involved in cell wall biosynthesis
MEGGVGAFSQELAKALAAAGHEVHIITGWQARPVEAEDRRWSARLQPVDIGFAQLHPRARRWRWGDVSLVADIAHRYELDIVNIQYQAAAYNMRSAAVNFLPWRLKGLTKTVVTFHDLRVPYLFPKAGGVRRWVVAWMARQANGVIVTNRGDYEEVRRLEIGDWRLREIPIGSNVAAREVAREEVAAVRGRLGVGDGACLLGYFGFLNESKGADTLVRALAQLPETVHLVFIGGRTGSSDAGNNGAYLAQLEGLIGALGLGERVHWTGFVAEGEVSAYLAAADVMVMPYRDGVSLRRGTLMAALAHGRPLITTEPAVLTPALVHGGNVWLTPVEDVAALVQAIGVLAADPLLRAKLGEGAAELAGRFTWDKIAAETVGFFEEVLGKG